MRKILCLLIACVIAFSSTASHHAKADAASVGVRMVNGKLLPATTPTISVPKKSLVRKFTPPIVGAAVFAGGLCITNKECRENEHVQKVLEHADNLFKFGTYSSKYAIKQVAPVISNNDVARQAATEVAAQDILDNPDFEAAIKKWAADKLGITANEIDDSKAKLETETDEVATDASDNDRPDPCGPPPADEEKIDAFLKVLEAIEDYTGNEISSIRRSLLEKLMRDIDFKKIDRASYLKRKKEYSNKRLKMIDEWEKNTGMEWPRYPDGAKKRYDAHHIIEVDRGGVNEWWNIEPLSNPDQHQGGIHGKKSPMKKLYEIVDREDC